jgi:murein DD-endopeptidase MepM/ murein hydrolase activator NlpD
MAKLAEQQAAKNMAAPVVGGSGNVGSTSAGGSFASSNVNLTASGIKNFKTVGGKVIPVSSRQSQGYGKSRIKYAAGRHTGVDFGAPVGTQVRSAGNGIVTRVGREGAYGNTVHVRQADGTTALYAHLSGSNVKAGQKVKAGQPIAKTGNTGRSTGAHLHFEIRSRDKYGGDINPYDWMGKK